MSNVLKLNTILNDDTNELDDYILETATSTDKRRMAQLGKKHTAETRAKMSISQRGKIRSPEARANISNGAKGVKHAPCSEETKKLLSEINSGRVFPKITCPYCNYSGGITSTKRWHFENCAYKHISFLVKLEQIKKEIELSGVPQTHILKKYKVDKRRYNYYIETARDFIKEQSSENYC